MAGALGVRRACVQKSMLEKLILQIPSAAYQNGSAKFQDSLQYMNRPFQNHEGNT